jgi:hypothetical protein
VSSTSARAKNWVSRAPGIRHVTVTPVSFNLFRAERAEVVRRVLNGGLIGADQQIQPVFGAAFGQLIADAG